ncbi:hypothetical protein M408DRAFT_237931 [Serendipita vermifera MAFF 305830]|uniref:NAD(P)-binding protein n=1 Tax=Serendipita vermifera MAFF 305830 TaxID=933852 RepID=A0A0C3B4J3_SERVB|nr:hypothetical protein M408DRAFT_237931 [Serendipita vermifera MAFF 305830]
MLILLEGFWKWLLDFGLASPRWTVEDMPDLTGKVAIVTGGNAGIGYDTAKGLLRKNATVYIGARSIPKAEAAIKSLVDATGNPKVFILKMDLSDLGTVKQAAKEFQSKEGKLHILINNAGILSTEMDVFTAQGYDQQFGTNVLGHYFFSKLLMPLMESTAATLPSNDPVRLVELTSDGHVFNTNSYTLIDYDTLKPGKGRDRMDPLQSYYQSKSGNLLVSKARARLLTGKNTVSICVHPGRIKSALIHQLSGMEYFTARVIAYPSHMGPITSLYAATAPEAAQFNGKYLGPWARVKNPRSDHVGNIQAEDKLITWLEEQIRIHNRV